jgi:hypothetical protein
MAWRPLIPALVGALLMVSSAAAAERTAPKALAPGETGTFTVSELPADRGFTLEMSLAQRRGPSALVASVRGVTDAAGAATVSLTLPERYQLCAAEASPPVCEWHPVFPGLALWGSACSDPYHESQPGLETSSVSCVSVPAPRVAGKAAKVPRRVKAMKGIRWRNWGARVARGRRGGRPVRAARLVDCGGRLYYSRLTVGSRTRKRLAPCASKAGAQVYPGARVAGASR